MRATCLSMVVTALVVLGGAGVSGQGKGSVGRVPRAEVLALNQLVDGIGGGAPAGGDASINWDGHFMRAADGRVYVPFTVTLDDVAEAFESVTMYVRVMPRGAKAGGSRGTGSGLNTAESAPGSNQFSGRAPTVGGSAAQLGMVATELGNVKRPFEGFFIVRMPSTAAPQIVRRSLTVAPGDYDLYVAIRERPGSGRRSTPRTAVLKRELSVPELAGSEPSMSSVILADRIDVLAKRVPASQESERPYAFGNTEIFPDADAAFAQDAVLSVVFFVYNLAVDEGNLPDVTVQYRFRRASALREIFGELPPQHLARDHAPPAFDAKAGHQLAVTQALPLASFPPDTYELEIVVSDNLSGRSLQKAVRFMVG